MNAAALLQQTAPYSYRSAYLLLCVLPHPRTPLSPHLPSFNRYRHRCLINIARYKHLCIVQRVTEIRPIDQTLIGCLWNNETSRGNVYASFFCLLIYLLLSHFVRICLRSIGITSNGFDQMNTVSHVTLFVVSEAVDIGLLSFLNYVAEKASHCKLGNNWKRFPLSF